MPKPWLFIIIFIILAVALLKSFMAWKNMYKVSEREAVRDIKTAIGLWVVMIILLIYYIVPILSSL